MILVDFQNALNRVADGDLSYLKSVYAIGAKLGVEKSFLQQFAQLHVTVGRIKPEVYLPDTELVVQHLKKVE